MGQSCDSNSAHEEDFAADVILLLDFLCSGRSPWDCLVVFLELWSMAVLDILELWSKPLVFPCGLS